MTTEPDRVRLLTLARDAIAAHCCGLPVPIPMADGVFARRGGAFVTLNAADGTLRGYIGHLEDDETLGRVVSRCAVAAAFDDPRFAIVGKDELATLQIELSLIGTMETIAGVPDIEVGRHGLVVEHGRCRGVLLPQVATEWGWDVETFLAHTCRKAGLPDAAWQNGAALWRFEAEVFCEVK
jgi:AmmeMemoRadiSam system protein A